MGLKISASSIDGTSGTSTTPCLSDSLVSVGPAGRGGTGSFISDHGLIITNWHVAHDAVRQASIKDDTDYLSSGFVAQTREQELKGADYEVWITKSCRDVSSEVVAVVRAESDPLKRSNKLRDCSQALASAAEEALRASAQGSAAVAGSSVRCDVKEMWPNETYVLFTYERLQDVRIVYVPPQSLGNFGGDNDNFEWPRHTADFTLLRAYVAPDGSSAPPHENNIPYTPSASLKVSEKGAQQGDFVFLLGFPGHTLRYAPSPRLKYSDEVAVPALVADFGRKLDLISTHEKEAGRPILALAGSKKSLANEFKRSKGKRIMMKKLDLVGEREREESNLCAVAPEFKSTLNKMNDVYDELRRLESTSSVLEKLRGIYAGSALLYAGHTLHEGSIERLKPDEEREIDYRSRNRNFLISRLTKRLSDIHVPLECDLIRDAVTAASEFQNVGEDGSFFFATAVQEMSDVKELVISSGLRTCSKEYLVGVLEGTVTDFDDPFIRLAKVLHPIFTENRDRTKALLSKRDELQASLLEIQRIHSSESFYPDANSTLRISAGHVEGYSAADAVWYEPITTLQGLHEKAVEEDLSSSTPSPCHRQFSCPERLSSMLQHNVSVKDTPVNILYSTDTVGGNSGSPVLSAKGEFVAINFDRQRQGLMNEFKWSPQYSRSIGVDVRYILWLIGKYDRATELIREILRQDLPVPPSPR